MVDKMTKELRSLDKKDATTLFRYYWDRDRDEMFSALARANMNSVSQTGNMIGEDDYIKALKFRLEFNMDKFNYKDVLKDLKELSNNDIDFDELSKLHSLIAKISLSCNEWTVDTIELLLNESDLARTMAGFMLVSQASMGCINSIDSLITQEKVLESDINNALKAAIRDNDGSDGYKLVIEKLLKSGKISDKTINKLRVYKKTLKTF